MPKKMFFRIYGFVLLLLKSTLVIGQCPSVSINTPSNVCLGDTISLSANGSFASYEWDLSPGDLEETPTATNLGNVGSSLASARNISIIKDGATWYGFINHLSAATVYRLTFGNSLENTPTIEQLVFTATNSNPGTSSSKIRFRKEGNNWYGIQVTDQKRLLVFNFGNSLANNNITATCHINPLGLFASPRDIVIAEQNDSVFALVMNYSPDNISVLRFGTSIANNPISGYNETIIEDNSLLNNSSCFALAKYCGDWLIFAASPATDNIARINFGAHFNGAATGAVLFSSATAENPQQIELTSENGRWYGFYKSSSGGGLTKLDFGTDLMSTPSSTTYSNFGGLTSGAQALSVDLVNDSSRWYAFVTNYQSANERLVRLDFPNDFNGSNWSLNAAPNISAGETGTIQVAFRGVDNSGNTFFASDSIIVNPTANPAFAYDGVCENVSTSFSDSSTSIDSIASWLWHFGNGDSSVLSNPSVTYTDSGTYSASLTLTTVNGCVSSTSQSITIYPDPQALFFIDTTCAKVILQIIDSSSAGNDSISGRYWLFESDSSTLMIPSYAFDSAGSKTVMLAIQTNHGCVDTGFLSVFIRETPAVDFDLDLTCLGDTTLFENQSSFMSGGMNTLWNFGDGGTSTQFNAGHEYAAIGSYNAQLKVTGSNGCEDSVSAPVVVSIEPIVSFSSLNNPICNRTEVSWVDNSTVSVGGLIHWEWDFGDGSFSSLQDPVMIYDSNGTYTVKLRAYSGTKCSNLDSLEINVLESPTMDFIVDANCANQSTEFFDISSAGSSDSIVGWNWMINNSSFGLGAQASTSFNEPGIALIQLHVSTQLGCSLTLDSTIHIRENLSIGIVRLSELLCTDVNVKHKAITSCDTADSVLSYRWETLNGNQVLDSGFLKSYNFLQSAAQDYGLRVEIKTNLGCIAMDSGVVSLIQAPISIIETNIACKGDTTFFADNYSGSNYRWTWNFGDGISIEKDDPFHIYQDSGSYNASVILLDKLSGCYDSTGFDVLVNPEPVPLFSSDPLCANTNVRFKDATSLYEDSVEISNWNIVDVSESDLNHPVFLFSTSGKYIMHYSIETANGCRATSSKVIEVQELPIASFDFNPFVGAPPLMVELLNTSNPSLNYFWRIGTQDSIQSDSFKFENEGEFDIELRVSDNFGCTSSTTKSIQIGAVEIDLILEQFDAKLENGMVEFDLTIVNRGNMRIENPMARISLNQDNWFIADFDVTLYPGERFTPNIQTRLILNEDESIELACARLLFDESEMDVSPWNNSSCKSDVGISTFFNPYPNPTLSQITLPYFLSLNDDLLIISVFNALGELMFIHEYKNEGEGYGSKSYNVSDLPLGLYYLNASFGKTNESFKFIKE